MTVKPIPSAHLFGRLRDNLVEQDKLAGQGVTGQPIDIQPAIELAEPYYAQRVDLLSDRFAPIEVSQHDGSLTFVRNPVALRKQAETLAVSAGVTLLPRGDQLAENLQRIDAGERSARATVNETITQHFGKLKGLYPADEIPPLVTAALHLVDAGFSDDVIRTLTREHATLAGNNPRLAAMVTKALKDARLEFEPNAENEQAARVAHLSAPNSWLVFDRADVIKHVEAVKRQEPSAAARTEIFEAAHGHLLDAGKPALARDLAKDVGLDRTAHAAADGARAADGVYKSILTLPKRRMGPDLDWAHETLALVASALGPARTAECVTTVLEAQLTHRLRGTDRGEPQSITLLVAFAQENLPAEQQFQIGKSLAACAGTQMDLALQGSHAERFSAPAIVVQEFEPGIAALLSSSHRARVGDGAALSRAARDFEQATTARLQALAPELLARLPSDIALEHGEPIVAERSTWLSTYVDRGALSKGALADFGATVAWRLGISGGDKDTLGRMNDAIVSALGEVPQNRVNFNVGRFAHLNLSELLVNNVTVKGKGIDVARKTVGDLTSLSYMFRAQKGITTAEQVVHSIQIAAQDAAAAEGNDPRVRELVEREFTRVIEEALGVSLKELVGETT